MLYSPRPFAAAAALAVALPLAACSENGSPTGPEEPQPRPPAVTELAVSQNDYREARLTATVTDPDGDLSAIVVDWGDGKTSEVEPGSGSVSVTHKYPRADAFSVTLQAVDSAGAQTESSRSVTIELPPEACLGIEVIEVCARIASDFRNISVSARAGEVVLASFNIDDSNPSLTTPLGVGTGSMTTSFNFDTGVLKVETEYCTIPFLVCHDLPTKEIRF